MSPPLVFLAVSRRVLYDSLCCDEERDLYQIGSSPPFAAEYRQGTSTIAVGDEMGTVTMIDTMSRDPRNAQHFSCHHNAIFDLGWVPGQRRPEILTPHKPRTNHRKPGSQ